MKVKTIDIQAKEWFDKVNGNSYFSAVAWVNFRMKSEKEVTLPFQYGYGDHYIDMAKEALEKAGHIKPEKRQALWRYCEENNIILRTTKRENCKKREL